MACNQNVKMNRKKENRLNKYKMQNASEGRNYHRQIK